MKCQVLIASYAPDAEWLECNLRSLKKFSVGLLPPVIAVSQLDYDKFRALADSVFPETHVKVHDGHGFMRAQGAMLCGDILCPDADFVLLLGSDCLAISEFKAEDYFHKESGKPVMLYNTFQHLLKHHPGVGPWQKGTERALGIPIPIESMRRLPLVYPKALYPAMRAHVENLHGIPFQDYLYKSEKEFGGNSESNILGSYAWHFMRDIYHWIGMDDRYEEVTSAWPNAILQFWSKGGLDRRCDQKFAYPGGNTFGKTPRAVIKEVLALPDPTPVIEEEAPEEIAIFDREAPMVHATPRLVCALGISHRDVGMAETWLKWTSFLASQPGGSQADSTLIIAGTRRVTSAQWAMLRAAVIKSPGMFSIQGYVLEDENEVGYPVSASHLFVRTMEHAAAQFPGSPILWVEADTVPIRPGWFSEIEREYSDCGKPFMGYLEAVTRMPHMAGVAVYPPNWKELAPKLEGVLQAPDTEAWGRGKGQAFDIYAADQTVPQMAQARSIQQIWRPAPFNAAGLSKIRPETALFHQCKDGKLIAVLATERYPDFVKYLKKPAGVFVIRGHHQKAIIGHEVFPVSARVMRLKGGFWSVIKPRSSGEAIKLGALCVPGEMEEVTEEQLAEEQRKRQKIGRVQHV